MKIIEGYNIDYDFREFRKIADLVYFDGPFLSHYVSGKGDDFLFNPNDGYLYVVDIDNSLVYHDIKLVQPSALPDDYLPESDSYYEFEPIPAEDAEELMTYELTIPYKERNHFEEILRKIGFPVSALKKVVSQAAVF